MAVSLRLPLLTRRCLYVLARLMASNHFAENAYLPLNVQKAAVQGLQRTKNLRSVSEL